MKPIIINKDCRYNLKYLYKGDIIEPTKENLEMIIKLNVGGFINPLTQREIESIENGRIKDGKDNKQN